MHGSGLRAPSEPRGSMPDDTTPQAAAWAVSAATTGRTAPCSGRVDRRRPTERLGTHLERLRAPSAGAAAAF